MAADFSSGLRVGISGSYGGINLGDEAILHGILAQLRSIPGIGPITVFTRDPEDTLARHAVDRAVAVREMTREEARAEVKQLDLFILGGGGLLYDLDVAVYLREVALANEAGVPVAVYAISAGPLDQWSSRELIKKHLTPVALLTVRDRHALRLLQDAGVQREIHLTADPALLLEPEKFDAAMFAKEGLADDRPLVAFSVREPGPAAPDIDTGHYHALLADTADFVIDRYRADVVFVPMERRNKDLQHSHAVIARMQHAHRVHVLRDKYTPHDIMALLSRCTLAVGMRLHFLIFAALQGVPFVALPYASKVSSFLHDLGMPAPDLEDVSAGQLIAYIDRAWDMRASLCSQVARALPELQQRARRNNELVMRVIERSTRRGQRALPASPTV